MAPLAPCDCASAGAVSDSDSRAERMYLNMRASIQRIYGRGRARIADSAVKSEHFVGWIHFPEVVSQQDAARQICAGHALTRVAKSEQMVRVVAVRADARQSLRSTGIIRGPSERRLHAGDIRIQGGELVHQLTGPLHNH